MMLYGSLIDQNFFANHFQGGNAMGRISSGADELGSDFDPHSHLFFLQRNCTANSKLSFPVQAGRSNFTTGEILTGTATGAIKRNIYRVGLACHTGTIYIFF